MSFMSRFTGNPVNNPGMSKLWERWFDTLAEQGVDRLADQSVGERRGMFQRSTGYAPTFDPSFQSSAVVDAGQSNQIDAPSLHPALAALQRLTGRRGTSGLRVRTQRGTSGFNRSERV